MGNHYYIISEDKFHRDKERSPTSWEFVEGTGIDLNLESNSRIPTIKEIKNALIAFGLEIVDEYKIASRLELNITDKEQKQFWLIFTDLINDNDESYMFEIGRGSNYDLAINFIKFLGHSFGNFLFYCDSGAMSLITPDKDLKLIFDEMNS